jgi:hypothetical protein
LDRGVEFFEISAAVPDGRAGHGCVGFGGDIDWTWDEEFGLRHGGGNVDWRF